MPEELSRFGVEVAVARLDFGDACFSGNGEQGECMVGCERKKLPDLVNSMRDRRLSGFQLRGMWKAYDYVFLFAEGTYRPGPGGEIEELRGRDWRPFFSRNQERTAVSYRQLMAYLTTLELKGGIVVRRTASAKETAAQYVSLHKWFNDKTWSEHHSHDQLYSVGPTPLPIKGHRGGWARPHGHDEGFAGPTGRGRSGKVVQSDPTTLWRVAAQFPGIDRRSEAVAAHFKTVENMALAGLSTELRAKVDAWFKENPKVRVKAWRAIGNGIGEKTAEAAVRAMTEEGA